MWRSIFHGLAKSFAALTAVILLAVVPATTSAALLCTELFLPGLHPLDAAARQWATIFPYTEFSSFEPRGALLSRATGEPWGEAFGPHAAFSGTRWSPRLEVEDLAALVRFANARMDQMVQEGIIPLENAVYLSRPRYISEEKRWILERWDQQGLSPNPTEQEISFMQSRDFFEALVVGRMPLGAFVSPIFVNTAMAHGSFIQLHELAHFSAFLQHPEYLNGLMSALRRLKNSWGNFVLPRHHASRVDHVLEGLFVMSPEGDRAWPELTATYLPDGFAMAEIQRLAPRDFWTVADKVVGHFQNYWQPLGGGLRTPNVASGFTDLEPLRSAHILKLRLQIVRSNLASAPEPENEDREALRRTLEGISALYRIPLPLWMDAIATTAPLKPQILRWLRLQSNTMRTSWGDPSLAAGARRRRP